MKRNSILVLGLGMLLGAGLLTPGCGSDDGGSGTGKDGGGSADAKKDGVSTGGAIGTGGTVLGSGGAIGTGGSTSRDGGFGGTTGSGGATGTGGSTSVNMDGGVDGVGPDTRTGDDALDVPISNPDGSDAALDVNVGIDGPTIPQVLDGGLDGEIDVSPVSLDAGFDVEIDTTPSLDGGMDVEGVDGSADVS